MGTTTPRSDMASNKHFDAQPRRLSASFHQYLDDANCMSWGADEVALWMRGLEGGLIVKLYPQILDGLRKLNVNGVRLKALNDMNLEQLGITDALHRALIM